MTDETKKSIKKLIGTLVVLIVLLLIGFLIIHHFGIDQMSKDELQQKVQEYILLEGRVVAPLIFILISFLQVTFVPIPGAITILAGNFVFGFWYSFLYSYIGMLAGGMFAYLLGKWIGRPFANWLAGGKDKVDDWLLKLKGRENVLLFFMFLFPFFPDDLLCTVAGLLPISGLGFFLMQVVTRATSIGGTLLIMSGNFIPWHGWGLVVLIVLAILFVIAFFVTFMYAEQIDGWVNGLFRKVYYGEQYFYLKKKGRKAGTKSLIGKKVIIGGKKWRVSSVYKMPEGFVVDIYSSGATTKKTSPQNVNFTAKLEINDDVIEPEYQFETMYHPINTKNKNAKKQENAKKKFKRKQALKYMVHYKLDKNRARRFVRLCFPYDPKIERKHFCLLMLSDDTEEIRVDLSKKKKKAKDVIDLVKE